MNKWVEGYLWNYVSSQHKAWVKWIHLCEYCYNSTDHMTMQMFPFKALYGYDPPSFMNLLCGDSRVLNAGDML